MPRTDNPDGRSPNERSSPQAELGGLLLGTGSHGELADGLSLIQLLQSEEEKGILERGCAALRIWGSEKKRAWLVEVYPLCGWRRVSTLAPF